MPNPVASDVHVSRPLTNISIAYLQKNSNFVADQVFANIPVEKEADKYFRYDRADFFRNQMEKRADSSESAGSGWKINSDANYFCDVWALHKDVSDRVRSNQDAPLSMDRDTTEWLTLQGLISREVNFVSNFFTTGVWTGIDGSVGDIAGVASSPSGNQVLRWDLATSTPVADIKAYCTAVQRLTGLRPNTLTIGREVWDALSEHPDVIDRIKYSGGVGNDTPAVVSRAAFAALVDLDRVLVADGVQVTSAENEDFEQSMTAAFIAGKGALLSYSNPAPSLLTPSAGYTFSWKGLAGAGDMGGRIKKFRMENLEADRIEKQMAYDQKVVASDCAVFFNSIVA